MRRTDFHLKVFSSCHASLEDITNSTDLLYLHKSHLPDIARNDVIPFDLHAPRTASLVPDLLSEGKAPPLPLADMHDVRFSGYVFEMGGNTAVLDKVLTSAKCDEAAACNQSECPKLLSTLTQLHSSQLTLQPFNSELWTFKKTRFPELLLITTTPPRAPTPELFRRSRPTSSSPQPHRIPIFTMKGFKELSAVALSLLAFTVSAEDVAETPSDVHVLKTDTFEPFVKENPLVLAECPFSHSPL
jgi:hypothetical protein